MAMHIRFVAVRFVVVLFIFGIAAPFPLFAVTLSEIDKAGVVATEPVIASETKIYTPQVTSSSVIDPGITATVSIAFRDKEPGAEAVLPDPVASGLTYLAQTQNPDGSWSENGKASFLYTAAVAELLARLDTRVGSGTVAQQKIDAMYPNALDWLRGSFPENTNDLASKITLLANAGDDMSSAMDYLAAQLNESDFGFGYKKEFGSDVYAVGEVLKALAATNYEDPGTDTQFTLKAALMYVLSRQNVANGYWDDAPFTPSQFATNAMLRALFPYQGYALIGAPAGDIVVNERIAKALSSQRSGQWPDGSWWGEVVRTALLYDTIIAYNATTTLPEARSLSYLLNRQNPDGSFMAPSNVYATTKALQAITHPDISVVDMQNMYATSGAFAGLAVIVRNNGYATSLPVNIDAVPSALHLWIDGQVIGLFTSGLPQAITLEPQAEVIFQIQFSAPVFGMHNAKFSIDYPFPEHKKADDALTKYIQFNTPPFSGPQPPGWIGASTGGTPGNINLRWQFSTDPATNHLVIYASTVRGAYDDTQPFYIPDGNVIGVDRPINPSFYGVPIYFTIVAVNAQGQHGNYSQETWATAYANPQAYHGVLAGRVYDAQSGRSVADGSVVFWNNASFPVGQNGNYSADYYPGFYLADAQGSTYGSPQLYNIRIIHGESRTQDFPVFDTSIPVPPPVAGLTATPGEHDITLQWAPYTGVTPSDFKRFRIYRENNPFSPSSAYTPIDLSMTDSAATSFVDTTVVSGVLYHYIVLPENIYGRYPWNVSSIGPYRANSPSRVTNVQAAQNGPRVDLVFDLADDEQLSLLARFQYWDGAAWVEMNNTVGEGTITPGAQKLGVWNAKQEFPNFEGLSRVKVIVNDLQQVNTLGEGESPEFFLDTRDPVVPTVDAYASSTGLTTYQFTGGKEASSSLVVNGTEVVPVNTETRWAYAMPLVEGANTFEMKSIDSAGNESEIVAIEIIYAPVPPGSGGSLRDGRVMELVPLEDGSN